MPKLWGFYAMPISFIDEIVDIYSIEGLPNDEYKVTKDHTLVLGDLHGNAIKLLYCLMLHGFIAVLQQQEYDYLVTIYVKPAKKLTSKDIQRFNEILDNITCQNQGKLLLIGDVLADRGSNDYWTLKILALLKRLEIPVEILLSNHDSTFIEATELQKNYMPQNPSLFNASMVNLQQLIDMKLIEKKEVDVIANQIYKPMLKALSYSLAINLQSITLFSHAAIGLNTINYLSQVLQLKYDDKTPVALCKTIDAINHEFQKFVQKNQVHELYCEAQEAKDSFNNNADLTQYPFAFIMYNRLYHHIQRPKKHSQQGYALDYVHGHDSDDHDFKHLNNTLGMSVMSSGGAYSAILTSGYNKCPEPKKTDLLQRLNTQPTFFSLPPSSVNFNEKIEKIKQSLISSGQSIHTQEKKEVYVKK